MVNQNKKNFLLPSHYFILAGFFMNAIRAQIENNLVEELAVNEWPIEEDTDQVSQYTVYEDNNDIVIEGGQEEEEEDDVDNDDYEEEEDDTITEDPLNNTEMDDNHDGHIDDSIDTNEINNEDDFVNILDTNEGEYQPFLIKATSPLQQQEEQLLNDIDQNIITTLENAIDTIKQDKPIRHVPVQLPSPTSPVSIYLYWVIGLLCVMILVFTWKKSKKHAFQEQLLPIINDKKRRVKKEWV
ncbi:unnamed protein product [Cunninghamella blakesleeana]